MAKRFIDTERHKVAHRGINPKVRLAYWWTWMNCDAAGVWVIDAELFRFECGYPIDIEALTKACPTLQQLPNGALFHTDFVPVNYGSLKPGYNPHKPVFRSLELNGIDPVSLNPCPSLGQVLLKTSRTIGQDFTNPCQRVEGEEEGVGEEVDEEAGRCVGKPPREPEPPPTDLPFASPAFAEAWQIWETSRREKRKPLTPTARRLQLAKCAEWGEARSIAALKHSASNDWQGVYEPPASRQDPTAARKSTVMDRNAVIETNLKTAR